MKNQRKIMFFSIFLEDLGIANYNLEPANVTNTPLLEHIAKLSKPMFVSTDVDTMEEIRLAYETVITREDVDLKKPTNGTPSKMMDKIIGKKLKTDLE